ncbi:MAG TPA: hypothetical protein VFQ22_13550, partial [Longimicrobiales bacterium]|nr:hypothetical protein [Longimicrobiales bacterium]
FDMEKQLVIRTIREVLGVDLTPAEEQAILENRMDNVLAFLAYGRGLRELDRGDFAAAQRELQLSIELEPGSFTGRDAALAEASDLAGAAALSTADLGNLATATGELGTRVLGPPASVTTDRVQGVTLANVSNGVAPPPTGPTLDLGSTAGAHERISASTRDTRRDAVQEAVGGETVPGAGGVQITVVIPRPGGTP